VNSEFKFRGGEQSAFQAGLRGSCDERNNTPSWRATQFDAYAGLATSISKQ